MLWPLSTSLTSGCMGHGTGVPAAASWQALPMGALRGSGPMRGHRELSPQLPTPSPAQATAFPTAQRQGANTASLDCGLLTMSGSCDNVTRPWSISESRCGGISNVWILYTPANASGVTSLATSS